MPTAHTYGERSGLEATKGEAEWKAIQDASRGGVRGRSSLLTVPVTVICEGHCSEYSEMRERRDDGDCTELTWLHGTDAEMFWSSSTRAAQLAVASDGSLKVARNDGQHSSPRVMVSKWPGSLRTDMVARQYDRGRNKHYTDGPASSAPQVLSFGDMYISFRRQPTVSGGSERGSPEVPLTALQF